MLKNTLERSIFMPITKFTRQHKYASITVDFDDSIIEDTAEIKRQALNDLNMSLISKAEYFRQVYKMDKEQSEKFVEEMAQEIKKEIALLSVEEEPEGV